MTRREFSRRVSCGAAALLTMRSGEGSCGAPVDSRVAAPRVDSSSLFGKVMCGYQGWFRAPGDGANSGWRHYSSREGRFEPGHCSIDFWPDVSEFDEDEKFPTPFRHRDGSRACVFSSHHPKTVDRHFRWMQEYGIDGVFVQRFGVAVTRAGREGRLWRNAVDTVLGYCRAGANRHGRAYGVMYDLTDMKPGTLGRVKDDWRHLVEDLGITRNAGDSAYLHHQERPVVAIWGIGFNSPKRAYSVEECGDLVDFFKKDPQYGGVTVMLGIPTAWRHQDRDSVGAPQLHAVLQKADVLSPWTVGRYRDLDGIEQHAERYWDPDLAWCRTRGLAYLPVVFPGFSWVNLQEQEEDWQIPRLGGQFLWRQYAALQEVGVRSVYQAMFDEMDEGTQIFKVTNDPPVGASRFRTYEGLPSDHYLWLVGKGAKVIQGKIQAVNQLPERDSP